MQLIRRAGVALAGAVAFLAVAGSPAAASPLYCGASRALTVDVAIQGAFWDAQYSAQSEGYYGACTIVGEPEIFESSTDPYYGHVYYAVVNVSCER
ncbi:hypothetical protein ABZS66_51600 [Dactylosporangium sp. NPDC005572]|uniref:hypothetical protein n=1 Tax=Dactylosporangium sp. NPDC005572 TaxID=3156889 RepID=UPI0033B19227